MCHPGRPGPHGEGQVGSPGFAAFHSAKSSGNSFPGPGSSRVPARISSSVRCESFP